MDLTFSDLKQLSELLKLEEELSDSDDDLPNTGVTRLGPGHIGASTQRKRGRVSKENGRVWTEQEQEQEQKQEDREHQPEPKDIWDDAEVSEGIVHDESEDPRHKPDYEIKYKQVISAEDIFLSTGRKTPGTASCEHIVVHINLPTEDREKVDLELAKQVLELRSPKFRLSLPLPHPVEPILDRVFWDSEKLVVILRMRRELDFVNF